MFKDVCLFVGETPFLFLGVKLLNGDAPGFFADEAVVFLGVLKQESSWSPHESSVPARGLLRRAASR